MKYLLSILAIVLHLSTMAQNLPASPVRYFLQKTASSTIPYGNNPVAGHYANAGDSKIYYEVYGKGKPIVLLHGGVYGYVIEMAQVIDSLSQTNQVIAIATRGHGRSEIGHEPITYEQRANDVLAVIKAVTKEKVIVLGFSDGAFTGFKFASMYPDAIEKLIAIGATELHPGMRKFQFSRETALSLDRAYFEQQLALMPEPDRWEESAIGMMKFYSGLTVDEKVFGKIACPVLLMSGERDEGCPLQHVFNTYRMIPNCQLGIIPNGPHTVIQDNFPIVWAMVVPFIKQ